MKKFVFIIILLFPFCTYAQTVNNCDMDNKKIKPFTISENPRRYTVSQRVDFLLGKCPKGDPVAYISDIDGVRYYNIFLVVIHKASGSIAAFSEDMTTGKNRWYPATIGTFGNSPNVLPYNRYYNKLAYYIEKTNGGYEYHYADTDPSYYWAPR